MGISQRLCTLILSVFLSASARGTGFDQIVFEGLSADFTCLLERDRDWKRVEVSNHLGPDQRELVLNGDQKSTAKMVMANCEYLGSDYVCTWGKRNYLKVSMSKVHTTSVNRMKVRPVLRGVLKTGVFRPEAPVSCPLVTQL